MVRIIGCTKSEINFATKSLLRGNLVAFPTETVYGLGADAQNADAVSKIYQVKGRPTDHPLIVHLSSTKKLSTWTKNVPEYSLKLASAFWPGPMTLILPRSNIVQDFLTGAQDNVAIRVPSHPVALALLTEFELQGGLGIVGPSANKFGKVSPTTANDVVVELSLNLKQQDLIIDGGTSKVGLESTIINCLGIRPEIVRPGAVTPLMIEELLGITLVSNASQHSYSIRVPGIMKSHYSPNAKVYINGEPKKGDGFIAIAEIPTPIGVIRLASPKNNIEFASILYESLRLADSKKLERVVVVSPKGDDIAIAIRDRLSRCSYKE